MPNVVLIVELEIEPESLAEFVDIAQQHGKRSLELEPGCLRFEVLRPKDSDNTVILCEAYTDDAALESHWESDRMAAYREKVSGMILGRVAHRCTLL